VSRRRILCRSLTPKSKESDGSASLPLREQAQGSAAFAIAFVEPRQVAALSTKTTEQAHLDNSGLYVRTRVKAGRS